MVAEQFLASARASGLPIVTAQSLGAGIYEATRASVAVAGCNTNLGIVLLAAPLLQAAQISASDNDNGGLRTKLTAVLKASTVEDSALVFQAIQLAEPGGLGRSEEHDVADMPETTLQEVMRYAAGRDQISGSVCE